MGWWGGLALGGGGSDTTKACPRRARVAACHVYFVHHPLEAFSVRGTRIARFGPPNPAGLMRPCVSLTTGVPQYGLRTWDQVHPEVAFLIETAP